jgi:methanogenic corrinoid protein MtbC1
VSDVAALAALRDRYLAAQLSGNRRDALQLLVGEGLDRGFSVRDLQLGVIQEAQREIGRLWQENIVSIAQEHMATAISQLALARLAQEAEPARIIDRRVVVACIEGELHDFPARIAADVLELAGFSVAFLGANVPTDSLISILAVEKADLLALSVTMTFNVSALRAAVPRIRAVHPKLPILIGGHACGWLEDLGTQVGADGCGGDADALVAAAERLTGVAA